ncbi:MAG: hypothetical protein U0R76_07055 [Candidatus Nanopelagicales bacterium]
MASDPALELRVSRLENDSAALYDLVSGISTTVQEHSRRLDGIDTHLEHIDGRLDGIDSRLDGIDGRLDGMDSRFDAMDSRFDAMDSRFDAMDSRFDGLAGTLAEVLRRLPDSA